MARRLQREIDWLSICTATVPRTGGRAVQEVAGNEPKACTAIIPTTGGPPFKALALRGRQPPQELLSLLRSSGRQSPELAGDQPKTWRAKAEELSDQRVGYPWDCRATNPRPGGRNPKNATRPTALASERGLPGLSPRHRESNQTKLSPLLCLVLLASIFSGGALLHHDTRMRIHRVLAVAMQVLHRRFSICAAVRWQLTKTPFCKSPSKLGAL